jgi:DnaK suppressor protein
VWTSLPPAKEIESLLRHRYDELWSDIRRELGKHEGQQYEDLIQGVGDPEDQATADVLVDLNLTEIDRDVEELRAVQGAIGRLRRGEYGRCQSCGQDISPARLEALPYAALCLECQQRAERDRVSTPSL